MDFKKIKPLKIPVYRDSGFRLEDATKTKEAFELEKQNTREPDIYIYSRYRNPTVVAVEEQLMKLEGAPWALLTQSGMAAIDLAVSIFQEKEDHRPWLFFSEIYGGTNSFIDRVLVQRRGISAHRFSPEGEQYDLRALEKLLKQIKPAFLYFETISNPMLMVSDGTAIIRLARDHGTRVIIDNTFATPYLWRPLEAGADLVIHSATKYLGGHGDLTAGVLCGTDPGLETRAVEYRKYVGHMLSPDDAWRLGTQLKTFALRMEKHCGNAMHLAQALEKHPAIEKVLYPGLPEHPSHELAKRLFGGKGYGGMVSFSLKGENPDVKKNREDKFITHLADRIPLIPSLGDTQSTLLSIAAVWGDKYPEPGMIRLSAGIEDPDELVSILTSALDSLD